MDEFLQVQAARQVVAPQLHRTPLAGSASLGDMAGVSLHFKLEMFQKTGAFKVRGVLNKLHHLTDAERRAGVVGVSSGNHAQALAYGARQHGIEAAIVMPGFSVESKRAATRGYGGEVILTEGPLMEAYLRVQRERGLTPVHPFDDPMIIAGAGTVGLEILEDLPEADFVIVPLGGGGLLSGVATAVKGLRPGCRVIGVEPEGAAVVRKSLDAGKPVELKEINTIADGLCPPFTGEHVFDRIQRLVDDVVTVSDEAILRAMRLILERVKVLAEPSAAASCAALLEGKVTVPAGARVVCVLSGGNVDAGRLKGLL